MVDGFVDVNNPSRSKNTFSKGPMFFKFGKVVLEKGLIFVGAMLNFRGVLYDITGWIRLVSVERSRCVQKGADV